MKQKIFVLYTGGTIGMTQSSAGLRPDTALVGQALAPFSDGMDFDWHVCEPLIDSSAVQLQNWCAWLDIIAAALPQYDGVLVLHGTDTLAYTANMFALALQGLDKPIVLTGSQWPYNAEGSDAPRNLVTAVAAFPLGLKQTLIAFDGKLYPAVGSSKISTETAAGFGNAHFGALAEWDETRGWHNVRIPNQDAADVSDGLEIRYPDPQAKIAVRTLIPGFAVQELADGLGQLPPKPLSCKATDTAIPPPAKASSAPCKTLRSKANCCLTSAKCRRVALPPFTHRATRCVGRAWSTAANAIWKPQPH